MDFKEEIEGIAKAKKELVQAQNELVQKIENLDARVDAELTGDISRITKDHKMEFSYGRQLLVNENINIFTEVSGNRCAVMLYIHSIDRDGHMLKEDEITAALPEFIEDFKMLKEKYPIEIYYKTKIPSSERDFWKRFKF